MNEKVKTAMLGGLAAVAILIAGVAGYRALTPRQEIPLAKVVSVADLARMEKENPGSLTDDQRKILASVPEAEKAKLLTKPKFSLAAAMAKMHPQQPPGPDKPAAPASH